MKKFYWFKNIVKVMLATVLVASVAITGVSGLNYNLKTDIDGTAILGMSGIENALTEDDVYSKKIINILLLGTDDGKLSLNEDARADSITIVSLNLEEKTAKIVSVERSVTVYIEEIEDNDWITHVFRYSGSEGVVKSVEDKFDIEIDKYVRVNFSVFKDIIDIMDGVEIELTKQEAVAVKGMGSTDRDLKEGLNLLNGHDALLYSRLRAIDSNYERMNRQKNVLKAIVNRAKDIPTTDLIKMAAKVVPQLETDFQTKEISSLIINNTDMLNADIQQTTIPENKDIVGGDKTLDGRILTRINIPVVNQKLHYFLYGELLEIDTEELKKYENYQSKYTANEVLNSDPHQDVDDELSVDYYEVEIITEVEDGQVGEPTITHSESLRGQNGVDSSSVVLPTRSKEADNTKLDKTEKASGTEKTTSPEDGSKTAEYPSQNKQIEDYSASEKTSTSSN